VHVRTFALLVVLDASVEVAQRAAELRHGDGLRGGGAQVLVQPENVAAAIHDASRHLGVALGALWDITEMKFNTRVS
jgi:hypothetical protein